MSDFLVPGLPDLPLCRELDGGSQEQGTPPRIHSIYRTFPHLFRVMCHF